MSGPGGVEAGRARVRVVSDTSKIPVEVKKVAEAIEKKIRIELPVSLDTDSVKAEIDRWKRRITEQTSKLPAAKAPVASPDMDAWSKQVRADVLKLQRSIDVALPVTADAERLRRDVAAKVRAVESGIEIGVPIDLEQAAQFRTETLQIVAEIEAIAEASHPTVEIETSVDRDSITRTAASIGLQVGGVRDLAKVSTQVALSASKAGAALATIGPPLLLAAGAAAAIAPALLTAVPAVAGLGAGVGVIALGLSGISDTLALAFDPEKTKEFKKALATLPPAAQGVVTAIVALREPFRNLQRSVQETLLKGVGPELERVGKKVLPALSGSLNTVATSLNRGIKGFGEYVSKASTLKLVNGLIEGSTKALSPLGGAFKSVTTALLQIGAAAAPAMKTLTSSIADGAKVFAEWIDRASKSGDLTKVISKGAEFLLTVFRTLGSQIAVVSQILFAIGPDSVRIFAAVGGAVTAVFKQLLKLGPIISANKALFAVLGIAVLALVSPVAAVVAAVVAAIVAFQQFGPQIMTAIAPFTQAFSAAWAVIVSAFQTALPIVQQAIGYVVASIASLEPQVRAMVGSFVGFFRALAPIVAQVVAVFVEKWPLIQATAKSVFTSVMSIVRSAMTIATSLIRAATAAITAIWNNGFGKVVLGITRGALTAVLGVVRGAFQVLAGIFQVVASVLKGDWKGAWDGIKKIVSGAKTAVVAVVEGLWEAIKGVFAGAKDFLLGIGADIVGGLVNGITGAGHLVTDAARALANKLPEWVRKVLGINSPSKVMATLGKWVVLGLAQGITKSRDAVKAAIDQITAIVVKSGNKAAIHAVRAVDDALLSHAKTRERLIGRLKDAQSKLGDLQRQARDYAAQTKANVLAGANVTTLKDVFGQTTLKSVVTGLQAAVAKARAFAGVIVKLKSLGLNGTALEQLIQAGPENGLAAARAILSGGRAAIDEVNRLQKQLGDAGAQVGKVGADALYGAGIRAAQGIVDGLKDRIADITAVMRKIAREMVATIRRELKIKSPSRVMREQGRWVPRGLALGITDEAGVVSSAMRGMVPTQVRAPRFSGSASAGSASSGGMNLFPGATIVAADPNEAANVFSRRLGSLASAVNLTV